MCTFKPLLGDYLDKELTAAEISRVESHLGECKGCRSELDELKSLSNMLGGLPQTALPAGFMDRLERRKSGRRPASSAAAWRLPVGARAVGFAFASLLAAVVVYDKVKLVFPVISGSANSLPAIPEDQLRLNAPSASSNAGSFDGARKDQNLDFMKSLGAASGGGAAASLDAAAKASTYSRKAKRAAARGEPIGVPAEEDKLVAANAPVPAAAAPAAASEMSNEALQRDLERQKRLLGVKQIVAPDRHPMGQVAGMGAEVQQLNGIPPAPALGGDVASLLKAAGAGGGGLSAARGASVAAPPAPVAAEGVVIKSEDERAKLWASRQMTMKAPRVDYKRQMLVVVFGPMDSGIEVRDVRLGLEGLRVQYHLIELPEGATRRTQAPPYQFRVVPLTDKPVSFDALP